MLRFQVESWIWYGIVLFVAFSRFVSRRMALGSLAKFEADEYVMIGILCFFTVLIATINIVENTSSNLLPPGYDVANMTQEDINERTLGSKLILVVEECQMIVVWGTKACLLIMYLRFTTLRRENIAIKAIAVYVVLSFVLMEILYLGVWCRPFHNYWAVPTPNPQCDTAINHLILNAVFNISSDVLMLALGVPMFIRIQIPMAKKIPLVGVFSLGIFVIIAAALSKASSFRNVFADAWVYWYVRESATAIIVANLPFVWLLYRRMFGIKTPSATRSRSKSGHNTISLRSRTESKIPARAPPRPRKGSDDSEMAFGLGKSEVCQTTTTIVATEETRRQRSFDDKITNDPSTTKHLGLFHGHRSRESDVQPQFHFMENAVLHDKKSAGSFV